MNAARIHLSLRVRCFPTEKRDCESSVGIEQKEAVGELEEIPQGFATCFVSHCSEASLKEKLRRDLSALKSLAIAAKVQLWVNPSICSPNLPHSLASLPT